MKKLVAIAITAVVMFMFAPPTAEAQHFHRGFVGPGWGGSGISISVGRGYGTTFGPAFRPATGFYYSSFNRGFAPGFVHPGFYRPIPVNSFYRGGFHPSYHRGFNRGIGVYYGRGFGRGCGW